jgi:hypothetical protein
LFILRVLSLIALEVCLCLHSWFDKPRRSLPSPHQVSSIAALSLALVYQGSGSGDAVEAILQVDTCRP